jgi:hypothetical protein
MAPAAGSDGREELFILAQILVHTEEISIDVCRYNEILLIRFVLDTIPYFYF